MPYKDPKKKRASRGHWRHANQKYVSEYNRKYREQHREYFASYKSIWEKVNRASRRHYHRKLYALKKRAMKSSDWARVADAVESRKGFMTQAEFERAVRGVLERHLGHK